MSIPENITADHILKAIAKINIEGAPELRLSVKYFLQYEGKLYPPKYVISIANYFANGKLLNPNPKIFNTYQAQDHLKSLDFEVIVKQKSKGKS